MSPDRILQEQIDYYRARAGEYDEWWFRQGRYDRGAEFNARWHAETAAVENALDAWLARTKPRSVLELACGTGLFTRRIAPRVARVTAIDASPEVLAINRVRTGAANVDYLQADLFEWQPRWQPHERHDAVFFGFWLSHVPDPAFRAILGKRGRGPCSERRRLSDRLGLRPDVDCQESRCARPRCRRRDAQAQ